jgi:hypothetical protein
MMSDGAEGVVSGAATGYPGAAHQPRLGQPALADGVATPAAHRQLVRRLTDSFAICAATWAASPAASTRRIASQSSAALSWRASKLPPEEFSMTPSTFISTLNRNPGQCHSAITSGQLRKCLIQ